MPQHDSEAGRATLRDQIADAILTATYPPEEWPDGPPGEGEADTAREQADAVLAGHWIVPKVPHDETVSVGPRILRAGWIRREAGTSDVDHTRRYAAQLLAAADAVEES